MDSFDQQQIVDHGNVSTEESRKEIRKSPAPSPSQTLQSSAPSVKFDAKIFSPIRFSNFARVAFVFGESEEIARAITARRPRDRSDS